MKKTKKLIIGLIAVFAILSMSGCGVNQVVTTLQEDYGDLETENEGLVAENESLNEEIDSLNQTIDDLETDNEELQALVDSAQPWFELSAIERQEQEEELQKQKEAEEKAKVEEEKKGYDSGITYKQLARNPDDYEGKKVKFYGKVIQVIEGDTETHLRIAVNSDYDDIIYVAYDPDIVTMRVLEDDKITVMGSSLGLYSYESTGSGIISIPAMWVDIIEFD